MELSTEIVSSLTQVASEVTTVFGDVAPIAVKIMGVGLVWTLAIRFFKRFAKA